MQTASSQNDIDVVLDKQDIRIMLEAQLAELMTSPGLAPTNLHDAVRHALLAPSKRLRSQLLYLIAEPGPQLSQAALRFGCAVEMVHTASLILDDLPCMDNAKMRRGQAATHLAHGQATAILGAIALLSRSFGVISETPDVTADVRNHLITVLSEAIGFNGLVAGQEIDLNGRQSLSGRDEIENLNWLKTGTLFVAAAEMGGILRGLMPEKIEAVRQFARHLGVAFQTVDDILDRTASAEEIGKDVRQDTSKATLLSILDAKSAKMSCKDHLEAAENALKLSGVSPGPILRIITKHFRSELSSR